jgi:hypothetical protein
MSRLCATLRIVKDGQPARTLLAHPNIELDLLHRAPATEWYLTIEYAFLQIGLDAASPEPRKLTYTLQLFDKQGVYLALQLLDFGTRIGRHDG